MGRLAGKNILITGGNSGIGLAAAQEFDREGARVAICGLNEGTLQAAKETLGAGSLAVRADVSNLPDLDTMFATIKREFGHLDGVFVNAGYSEFLLFEDVTEQSFDKVIAVNFKGAYFTIQKALPLLRPGSSVIINASVGARKGWPRGSSPRPKGWSRCDMKHGRTFEFRQALPYPPDRVYLLFRDQSKELIPLLPNIESNSQS